MPLTRWAPPPPPHHAVWAYAKLQHYHGGLMKTMAAESTRRIEEFSQQNLGEWSLHAGMGTCRMLPATWARLHSDCLRVSWPACCHDGCLGLGLACLSCLFLVVSLFLTMVSMSFACPLLFISCVCVCFPPAANLVWAFSKLAHLDEELMAAVAAQSVAHLPDLSLQHLTNIIWSFASIKWTTPDLMPKLIAGEAPSWGW